MSEYRQVSLKDLAEESKKCGTVESLNALLSEYSCPMNEDVQHFFKHTALTFAEQNIAPTYIVLAEYDTGYVPVGYYTITMKTIQIACSALSSKMRDRIKKFAIFDKDKKCYTISMPLIAQLGKNFANGYNELITGDDLLQLAIMRVKEGQQIFGGKTVYLECEDKPQLIDFYKRNGFTSFGKRLLSRDETEIMDGRYLIQMPAYL